MVWVRTLEDSTYTARRVSLFKSGQSHEAIDYLFEQEAKAEAEKQTRKSRGQELTDELDQLKQVVDETRIQETLKQEEAETRKEWIHKSLIEDVALSRKGLEQEAEVYKKFLHENAEQSVNDWLKSFDSLKEFVLKLDREIRFRDETTPKTFVCFVTVEKDQPTKFRIAETEAIADLSKLIKIDITKIEAKKEE